MASCENNPNNPQYSKTSKDYKISESHLLIHFAPLETYGPRDVLFFVDKKLRFYGKSLISKFQNISEIIILESQWNHLLGLIEHTEDVSATQRYRY